MESFPSVGGCGSGGCPRAAEPFVETDATEARFAQWHERVLVDPAAVVSSLGVAHDFVRVADRLEIARNEFIEWRPFRAGDLQGAVARRCERGFGDEGSNVVRSDGLEKGRAKA